MPKGQNQSLNQSRDDENIDYEPILKNLGDKLQRVNKEIQDSEEVKTKLQCQVNLMKLVVAQLMKKLNDKIVDQTDVKLDFKDLMVCEQLNLSFRKSRLDDSRRKMGDSNHKDD